ncbi:hypothetical protein [Pontibacter sp. SGAir0037]|uniref:hypothetical protein n=1 Tax=Pontibacter sp. SGAir0037 TaxID=2571030 RepID=UPI00143DF412|nr:hypothetical protein [Pontibacter sp. SGAir0037]
MTYPEFSKDLFREALVLAQVKAAILRLLPTAIYSMWADNNLKKASWDIPETPFFLF